MRQFTHMKNLQAFVAMRIGEHDTDSLFRKDIKLALAGIKITARRIDKIQHNEKIDRQIMEEIEAADLVVCDLTYARPSVYFEAGYASGQGVPVIYTCRSDHLADGATGDLAVHFDLRMENIVGWGRPDTASFRSKLAARTRHVLKTEFADRKAQEREASAADEFGRLAESTRLRRLREELVKFLTSKGFRGQWSNDGDLLFAYGFLYHARLLKFTGDLLEPSFWVGRRRSGGLLDVVTVRVETGFTLTQLKRIHALTAGAAPYDVNPLPRTRPARIRETNLLVSLRKVPADRLASGLHLFDRVDGDERRFEGQTEQLVPTIELNLASDRNPDATKLLLIKDPYGQWQGSAFGGNRWTSTDLDVQGDRLIVPARGRARDGSADRRLGKVKLVGRQVDFVSLDDVSSLERLRLLLDLDVLPAQ